MFEKIKTNKINYKTSELPSEKQDEFDLPALTAGIQNQGLNNYVPRKNATILKNVISISANGANTGVTFYQSKEFTVLQDAYAINYIYDDRELTDNCYLFIVGSILKAIYGNYEWTNKAGWEKVKEEYIALPQTPDGKIDFVFMERFISELEEERISELNTYLKATGLNEYELDTDEQNALKEIENVQWEEYKVEEIFKILSYKKRFDANKVTICDKGKNPYVVRTSYNNGIRGYIEEDEIYLNDGNTISFGQDTATMFYQEKPYFTGDKIKIMKPINIELFNKINAMFFLSALNKSFRQFQWGSASFKMEILNVQTIFLPIKNGNIDYDFMETIIKAIQKLVIKDVVLYADKKIEAYKKVINKRA